MSFNNIKRFIKKAKSELSRIFKSKFYHLLFIGLRIKSNRIFITNMKGSDYVGWAASLCNELLKFSNIEIIYVIKKTANDVPADIKTVKYNSLKYYLFYCTSKLVITNIRHSNPTFKKKGQFFIQAWHSGYQGGKKIEADVEQNLGKLYVKKAKADGKNSDLMISCSKKQTELFHRCFWYKGPVLECGSLDYVPLFDVGSHYNIKDDVYRGLGIPKDKKIALFAPTFRSKYTKDTYNIDFDRLLLALQSRFNSNFVILFHYHFNNPVSSHAKIKYDNIKFFDANTINIQKLEIAADVGIGDYSGFNTEMCLLNKPVFRYANDLDDYIADRDFYIPFKDQPFPYAFNNDQLVDSILNFDINKYNEDSRKFLDYLGIIRSSDAIKVVAKFIIDVTQLKKKEKIYSKYSNELIWPNN